MTISELFRYFFYFYLVFVCLFFLLTLSLKLHCTRILAKQLLQYFLFPSNTQQLIQAREEEQKLSLAKTCKLFYNWPLLSLKKISGLIKWRRFSPGQGSLSRWREETHIVSLFYIKFSSLLVNFLCGLVCSRWLFVRLDYLITLVESACRAFISAPALLLNLRGTFVWSDFIVQIPLIFFLFFSSCQWRWAMWSDWLHKERRLSSSTLHQCCVHSSKRKESKCY